MIPKTGHKLTVSSQTLQSISKQAAEIANSDNRLPSPLINNNTFTSSNHPNILSIDYNQVDVAMTFMGYQQQRRRQKKKMDERSLTDVYNLLDEIAYDAITHMVANSMDDLLPDILDGLR